MSEFTDHLRSVRERAPDHLVPILDAVIDFGCAHLLVTQGKNGKIGPLPSAKPIITVIGDDLHVSLGPNGFHPSIRKLFRSADAAVIVACAPEPELYAIAAAVAVLKRRHVVLVESRTERELEWCEFAKRHLRTDRIVLCAVRPEGRPQ
jgi:hypothetical protein